MSRVLQVKHYYPCYIYTRLIEEKSIYMQAYHHNIRYPTHSLLTFQWYNPQWWLVDDQDSTCTGEQRGQVLNRALSMAVHDTSYVDRENYNTTMNIVGYYNSVKGRCLLA